MPEDKPRWMYHIQKKEEDRRHRFRDEKMKRRERQRRRGEMGQVTSLRKTRYDHQQCGCVLNDIDCRCYLFGADYTLYPALQNMAGKMVNIILTQTNTWSSVHFTLLRYLYYLLAISLCLYTCVRVFIFLCGGTYVHPPAWKCK